jgi:TRAP-type C4-dicarboxylate transport system permease small subunit
MPHRSDEAGSGAAPVPSATDEHGGERLPLNPTVERLTRWLALGGGILMLLAIVITLVSVAGRYLLNAPLPGDYEAVEMLAAVGIFFFLPYTHATGSNIVVRFFTERLPRHGQRVLDFAHEVIFTLVAALMVWRLFVGFADKLHTGESSMLLRVPYWWSYGLAVAALTMLGVVCTARLLAGARALRP